MIVVNSRNSNNKQKEREDIMILLAYAVVGSIVGALSWLRLLRAKQINTAFFLFCACFNAVTSLAISVLWPPFQSLPLFVSWLSAPLRILIATSLIVVAINALVVVCRSE